MTSKTAIYQVLPKSLISREAVDHLRASLKASGHFPTKSEPDWSVLRAETQKDFHLTSAESDVVVRCLERLWLLPFRRYEVCSPLVRFYFHSFEECRARVKNESAGKTLCSAFEVLVTLLFQGCVGFPGEPHEVAEEIRRALESASPEARNHVLPLARLFAAGKDGRCGENHYISGDPNAISLFEHQARHGDYQQILSSDYKMQSYHDRLVKNPAFRREWQQLKSDFAEVTFWDRNGIVRRSLMQEGNRRRPSAFKRPADLFQAAFDVFCWKWFLYGMEGGTKKDKPLVQKLTCTFGPYGTTIFIPGYWSLDVNRDIQWKKVTALHQARGIARQGEKLDDNRQAILAQARKAKAAYELAKRKSLRGEARMEFIKKAVGLDLRTEDSQIRRLLRKTR